MLHALVCTRSALGWTRGLGLGTSPWDAPCFDLQLTQYDEKGWRATFYTTGMEHSPTSATGTGWSARRGMRCKVQRGSALLHASITPGGTVQ